MMFTLMVMGCIFEAPGKSSIALHRIAWRGFLGTSFLRRGGYVLLLAFERK